MEKEPDASMIISYMAIRRAIGVLGMLLPFILSIGAILLSSCNCIQDSISLYYHTIMRNVLVGIMFGVAMFFFAYRGYGKKDRIAGILTGVFAIGLALSPTNIEANEVVAGCTTMPLIQYKWVNILHFTSAFSFFSVLTYFSLYLFTRTKDGNKENHTPEKSKRNYIYYICGFVMISALLLIFAWFIFKSDLSALVKYKPVFWLETIALLAFGTSWLVKGQIILKDKQPRT